MIVFWAIESLLWSHSAVKWYLNRSSARWPPIDLTVGRFIKLASSLV
jgi:hypothetical protein